MSRLPIGLVAFVLVAGVLNLGVILSAPADARSCEEDWPTYRGDDQRTGACGNTPGPGTGEILWSIQTKGLNIAGSPAVVGDHVYFSSDQFIYAVDRHNGTVEWTYETGGGTGSSPAIVNGTLYIGSGDGALYAIDTAEGTLEWRYGTEMGINSPPSVHDGRVVVGLRSQEVLALDAENGDKLWNTTIDERVTTSPLLWRDYVFVGDRDETFYAIDAGNGSTLWTKELDGGVRHSPTLRNQTLYVGTVGGSLYIGDPPAGGMQAKSIPGIDFDARLSSSDGSTVFVSGGSFEDDKRSVLVAAEPDASDPRWTRFWNDALQGPPTIGQEAVYVGDSSGTIWAMDKTTGETLWQTETARPSRSPPTVADGVLYVGSDNFMFFAIDAGIGPDALEGGGVDRPPGANGPPGAVSNESPGMGLALTLALLGFAAGARRSEG